jgi:hypothetical protein
MRFEYINPSDIHSVWNEVKRGIEVIIVRSNEKFTPEDVYASIKSGLAQLFMIDDGFTVLQNIRNEFTNQPVLHIWLTYHSKANDDISADFHSNLLKLADNIGAKEITFTSPRRWDKYAGARLASYNYVIER